MGGRSAPENEHKEEKIVKGQVWKIKDHRRFYAATGSSIGGKDFPLKHGDGEVYNMFKIVSEVPVKFIVCANEGKPIDPELEEVQWYTNPTAVRMNCDLQSQGKATAVRRLLRSE